MFRNRLALGAHFRLINGSQKSRFQAKHLSPEAALYFRDCRAEQSSHFLPYVTSSSQIQCNLTSVAQLTNQSLKIQLRVNDFNPSHVCQVSAFRDGNMCFAPVSNRP